MFWEAASKIEGKVTKSDMLPPNSPHFSTAQILVVDDVEDNRNLLQVLLEGEGYQVALAEEGYQAIASMKKNLPHLVLLDIMMPGMDGCDVAEWMSENCPQVPVLFVTGFSHAGCCGRRINLLNDLIYKPIAFEELFEKARSLLNASRHRYSSFATE